MVLSEVAKRLMMMSGSDASTSAVECDRGATSRMNEVVTTTVPAGHQWPGEPGQELADRSGGAGLSPFKGSTVDPDAVKDGGDLAGNGNLCLLHADPLREFHPQALREHHFLVR